ncbi:Uncharacterised protein [Enterobacter cloacae]|nr:Uncharacterised protein [Enterobacter cloacae]
MTAGHHAARCEHHAVIKAFTDHARKVFLQLTIPLLLVKFILVVVKKTRYRVLLTDCLHHLKLCGKIMGLFIDQRNAFFGQ